MEDNGKPTELDAIYGPLPGPETEGRPISIGELTHRCNDAAGKMSNTNPHKLLFLNCGYALQQLFHYIEQLEAKAKPGKVM